MTITKKDTIVLAVLFNIVVLAAVLATARQVTTKTELPSHERSAPAQMQAEDIEIADKTIPQEEGIVPFDEIDQLLEDYISEDVAEAPAVAAQTAEVKKPAKNDTKAKAVAPADAYYIVKAGDNPWKIAKKFHISFEKLLQLNHLDEAKARNLKIGQKLKIRETP